MRPEADAIDDPNLVDRLRMGALLANAPNQYWYGGDATGYSNKPTMQGRIELAA